MKQEGFTVIELLVVIALIGLLASIVLVSFNLPEKRYRATVAKSLDFSQSIQNAIGIDAAGWWNFDDDITDGNVTDTSGNGNHGQLCDNTGCGPNKGPTRTDDTPHKVAGTGGGKSALSFDGGDDYVKVVNSTSLNITTEITLEAWVKTTDNRGYFVQKLAGGWGWDTGYGLTTWGLILGINTGGDTEYVSIPYKKNIFDNKWHYVAGVARNNDLMKVYVDGKLDNEKSFPNTITTNSATLTFSGRPGWDQLVGLIDEVRIYSQALSAGEIKKHYVEGLARHQDLAAK